jgi:hemerythrin-like domain-containing protein
MAQKLFDTLKKEHNEVKGIISQIEKKGDDSGDLMRQLSKSLDVHMSGEEKYFYPEMKEFPTLHEMIIEALEEHDAADKVLRKLKWMTFGEAGFNARLKVLKEMLEHHIEEEEKRIFPQASKVVSEDQLKEIEQNYLEYKDRKMNSVW